MIQRLPAAAAPEPASIASPVPRITLDQWRALVAVVEAGSHARAAERLHKSQSSITYALQQLEAQLGVEAFTLRGRRAVLTPTGELLYRRARFLVDEATALEAAARRASAGWEAELRIAVEIVFPTWLLLACLDRFGAESPHTRIEVIEAVLGHRTDLLETRSVDLAIFGTVPQGFGGEALMRVRFVLVAHPDHPLHHLGGPVRLADLRAHRHLVVRESGIDRASPRSVEATQRWTFSHMASSIEAARRGYGFAWLPEEKIRAELDAGTLAPLALDTGNERFAELYLIQADGEHAGPGVRRLAAIVREGVAQACREASMTPAAATPPAAPRAPKARSRRPRHAGA